MKNRHIGSYFDNFLEEEGLYAQTQSIALKRVLAYQLRQLIKKLRSRNRLILI